MLNFTLFLGFGMLKNQAYFKLTRKKCVNWMIQPRHLLVMAQLVFDIL